MRATHLEKMIVPALLVEVETSKKKERSSAQSQKLTTLIERTKLNFKI